MGGKGVTKRKRKSKIELAGDTVVQHIIEMAKNTDLSLNSMANQINKVYHLNLNKMDVSRFFQHNAECVQEMARDKSALSILRADIFLEHNAVMVKDIKTLDKQIETVLGEQYMDVTKRATTIANLIDKKGSLLLRHARLSGDLDDKSTNIHKMTQVNVFNKIDDEKSEIIQRLKQFSPHKTTTTPPKIPLKEEIVIDAEVIPSSTDETEEEMMILESEV